MYPFFQGNLKEWSATGCESKEKQLGEDSRTTAILEVGLATLGRLLGRFGALHPVQSGLLARCLLIRSKVC